MGRRDDMGPSGRYFKGDREFLHGLKEAELVEATPRATWALYLMLTSVSLLTFRFVERRMLAPLH